MPPSVKVNAAFQLLFGLISGINGNKIIPYTFFGKQRMGD